MKHPIASQRSKHIDVIHHFARERVARKEVEFAYCRTDDMKADILTKALMARKVQEVQELRSALLRIISAWGSVGFRRYC